MATCVQNSPERRGEIGCSIIENKPLPDNLKQSLSWHIDGFDSAESARKAAGPASVAFDAVGTSWLMTVESQTSDHHGGRHVAQEGPLQKVGSAHTGWAHTDLMRLTQLGVNEGNTKQLHPNQERKFW
jgi:hypothetical protein